MGRTHSLNSTHCLDDLLSTIYACSSQQVVTCSAFCWNFAGLLQDFLSSMLYEGLNCDWS